MRLQSTYDCGIYLRLSKDDNNGNLESMSISNQRQMLTDYVMEKGWNLREIYVDDGYTGTNFDRPDFKRMLRDVESGKINCVIVKDLSRFGRNYVKTGFYTEEYFPERCVRFIAVNDSIDTQQESNDIAPFQNILNEWYPKDISKKVRQVKKTNARKGMYMGSHAPYGYMKSPKDKHVLIIDGQAARILYRIRDEIFAGYSTRHIAERLTEDSVDTPYAYRLRKEGRTIPASYKNAWGASTITQLMLNPTLAGDLVQGKRRVVSFKTKKRIKVDPEDWIIVENTHEAIFTRAECQRLEELLKHRTKTRRLKDTELPSMFSGILHCADCGSNLSYTSKTHANGEKVGIYRCTKYVNNGKIACTTHRILEHVLEAIVLADIRAHAQMAADDRQKLQNRLLAALKGGQSGEATLLHKQQKELQQRQIIVADALKNLYVDKCTGKIPEAVFQSLMSDFSREQSELEIKLEGVRKRLLAVEEDEANVNNWIERIEACLDMRSLDRETVVNLIDSIVVHEAKKENGKRVQEIEITYRFVGNLNCRNEKESAA